MTEFYHEPVLLHEVLKFLITDRKGIYVDATLGGGGHMVKIFETTDESSKIIGFDEDIDAINYVRNNFKKYEDRLEIINDNFSRLSEEISALGYTGKISGVLFDLGVSSFQIDCKDKGFTYREDSPLDMRLNRTRGVTAEEILNEYPANELARIFRDYGEEKKAGLLARKICEAREDSPVKTSNDFINVVKKFYRPNELNKNLSKLFQALRIEINSELDHLKKALEETIKVLAIGGRIAVISYHSLEDRIVKNFFRDQSRECNCPPGYPQCMCGAISSLKLITHKPVVPTEEEIGKNVRARSAKLRVAERVK